MEVEEVGEESEEDFEPPPAKCSNLVEEEEGEDQSKVRILRDKKSTEDDKSPLELCLEYLQKILQRSANYFWNISKILKCNSFSRYLLISLLDLYSLILLKIIIKAL